MELWNFDLLWKTMVRWKKLLHYGQNYGTIPRTMELRFTNEKNMVDYKKLRNLEKSYNGKTMKIYQKSFQQIYSFRTLKLWYYGKK